MLLHALGLSSASWDPVIPALAGHFQVVTVDPPGFGDSPPLPAATSPTPAALAAAVAAALDDAAIHRPHVVGNSLGGWVALELAKIRPVSSLTLLAPAGLWQRGTPLYCRVSLRTTHWLARQLPHALERLVGLGTGRLLVLGQSHGRPMQVTPHEARTVLAALASSTGFTATLSATRHLRYEPAESRDPAQPPTAVAYGSRDLVLPARRWRRTEHLPAGTTVHRLPGCGHIPMADDATAVTTLIKRVTERGRRTPEPHRTRSHVGMKPALT